MSADRAEHVATVIRPALESGSWVFSDRFATATFAYQGYGRGLPLEALRMLTAFATGGLEPDVVLLVDVPVSVSRERVAARAKAMGIAIDRLEREDDAFHERVRAGYLALAGDDPRMHVLDGMRPASELVDEAERILGKAALPA